MSSEKKMKKITIVGSGLNFWMSACHLISSIKGMSFELVAVEVENQFGANAISTLPSLKFFNDEIGVDECDFVRSTAANFNLAINYRNWSNNNKNFYLSFSGNGFNYNGFDFVFFFIKNKLLDGRLSFDDYNLAAQAAKLDRFAHKLPDKSQSYYGYQLDVGRAIEFYKTNAIKHGIVHINASVVSVVPGDQGVNSLILDGLEHQADFFIDATKQGLIIGGMSEAGAVTLPSFDRHAQFTESSIHSSSSMIVSRGHRTVGTTIYTSLATSKSLRYFSEDEDVVLKGFLDDLRPNNLHIENDVAFYRKENWIKNCLAVGDAAFNFHTILSVETWLTHSFITRFINLFPRTNDYYYESQEFNRLSEIQLQRIIAFYAAHAIACGVNISEGYEEYQNKLNLFLARGIIPFYEGELFTESYWQGFLFGCDHCPASTTDLIHDVKDEWVVNQLNNMKIVMFNAAKTLPTQTDYRAEFLRQR